MSTRDGGRGLQDLMRIVEDLGRARRRGYRLFGGAYDRFIARNGGGLPSPASSDLAHASPGVRRAPTPGRTTAVAYPNFGSPGQAGASPARPATSIPLASPLEAFGVPRSPLAPRINLRPRLAPAPPSQARPASADPRMLGAAPDTVDRPESAPLDAFGPMPAGAKTQAPAPTTTSANGVEFIRSFERGPSGGFAATQYPSLEGGSDTIGWGHKLQPGEDFSKGLTQQQAEELYLADLKRHEDLVRRHLRVPVTQQQFDALVSLSYTSPGAITNSTLMKRLNNGDVQGAANQFPLWNKAGRPLTPLPGLTARRQAERDIFLNGVYNNH